MVSFFGITFFCIFVFTNDVIVSVRKMKMFNRTTGFLIAQLVFIVAVMISLKGNMYVGIFLMSVATACAIILFGNDNNNDNYYKLT